MLITAGNGRLLERNNRSSLRIWLHPLVRLNSRWLRLAVDNFGRSMDGSELGVAFAAQQRMHNYTPRFDMTRPVMSGSGELSLVIFFSE